MLDHHCKSKAWLAGKEQRQTHTNSMQAKHLTKTATSHLSKGPKIPNYRKNQVTTIKNWISGQNLLLQTLEEPKPKLICENTKKILFLWTDSLKIHDHDVHLIFCKNLKNHVFEIHAFVGWQNFRKVKWKRKKLSSKSFISMTCKIANNC